MAWFTWELCGPMFRPPTFDADNLGLDYTDGADARWRNPGLVVGPGITDLDCTSAGTAANTNSGVMGKESAGSAWFLFLGNGNRYTKLIVPTGNTALSKASTQPGASFTARIMSLANTTAPSGAPIVSIGQAGGNTYQNITAIAAENASDTVSACNETTLGGTSIIVSSDPPDRMAGLAATGAIYGNVLTASVTADASAWNEISKIHTSNITPTGFAMSENLWLVGTDRGLFVLNAQYKEFFPAFGLVPADADNCRAMRYIPYLGVLVPLVGQLRLQNGAYSARVGPEAFGAPNVIQGVATGIGHNADWTFIAMRNRKTSVTYILAARPREVGAWHGNPISFYCIDSFSDASEWVHVLEDPGSIRTNQLLAVGKADDLRMYRIGRTLNWTDDVDSTNNYVYRTSTTQTAYGNRMHVDAPMDVKAVRFSGLSLASGRTLTVQVAFAAARGEEDTQLVTVENQTGEFTVPLPPNSRVKGVRSFNPVVKLITDSASASPILEHGRISIEAEPA